MMKIDYYFPNVGGGVNPQDSPLFGKSVLCFYSRCLRAEKFDTGILIEYE